MVALQRLVAYERVSTARQGASGLGLEAQRKTIEEFAALRGADLLARFTEVESGKRANRPELAKALHLAKVTGRRWSLPSWIGCRAMRRFCWRSGILACASWPSTCLRRTI